MYNWTTPTIPVRIRGGAILGGNVKVLLTFAQGSHALTIEPESLTATDDGVTCEVSLTQLQSGGTESLVHTGDTAPAPMEIAYPGDTSTIRDSALACIATVENGVASTNYAIGAYLVRNGALYRVTRAIATGESITPGTNVTQTTVMAEVVRLTA